MAQSKESKFFLSGSVSPSRSEANLQPKRCIPRMLHGGRAGAQQGDQQDKAAIIQQDCLLTSPGEFFFFFFFLKMNHSFTEEHASRSVVNLGQICQKVSTKKHACSLFFFRFGFF